MSPGAVVMYIVHTLLTSGQQLADLPDALEALSIATTHGTLGSVFCCQSIYFTFAANRYVGKLADLREEAGEQDENVRKG